MRWAILGAATVMLLLVLLVGLVYAFVGIPEPADIAVAQSARVIDHQGRAIGRISAEADRVSIPLEQMPQHLRDAVVAVEDRSFYTHRGVSLPSIARAAIRNVVSGEVQQGGSTITQQYVKNAFVGNERTVLRKVKEAVLALKLERQRSKDEILELYLNTIYLGRGAYGVQAAAQAYFGKNAAKLKLADSAMLAGMIHAPESYDPAGDPEGVRDRRNTVLRLMHAQGRIDEEEQSAARDELVKVRRRVAGGLAPHALETAREQLEREIGPRKLYAGGVTVQLTLDRVMQRAAERAVRSVYDRADDPDAALVAIDPNTGHIRALVGARDFARRQLNIAMRGKRQPGSTFKGMVLAAAVDAELPTSQKYRAPAKKTFDIPPKPWTVNNYDRADHGTLTVRRATELSVNTVYAQLILDVGPDHVAQVANLLGIAEELPPVPSLALGTIEVTPLSLTSAYATLAARGVFRPPTLIDRVTDAGGGVLFEADRPDDQRAIEEGTADRVNFVLRGVIERGTGAAAQIGRPAAGKTGTTEDFNDAWFAGYTPDLATVVWNGYAEGGKKLRNVRGRNVTGGSFPAAIWKAFMLEALGDVPPSPFPDPPSEKKPSPTATPSPESPSPTPSQTVIPSTPKPSGSSSLTPSPTASSSPLPSKTASSSPTPDPSPDTT